MGSLWVILLAVSAASVLPVWPSPSGADKVPPVVTVNGGQLSGFWKESRNGRPIAAFEGIPYAKPPVGELRLKAPQTADVWQGIRQATQPGSMCVQQSMFSREENIIGDEDCLYINVYAPNSTDEGRRLAVMVFIHGGAFECGAGHFYQPDYILDQDVLLVTFNYRLGPLGFLSTGDEVIPGNFGLKDMVQALRWVKDNIAHFGGNPESVTIFGESAGGSSVHHLIMSPLSTGLFHRGISESGTALATWGMAFPGEEIKHGNTLAKLVGCPAEPSTEFKNCLLTKSATDITSSIRAISEWNFYPPIPFKPVVEHGPGAFHERHPLETLQISGPVNDVPFMTGFVSEEGCLFAVGMFTNDTVLKEFSARFEYVAPLTLLVRDQPQPLLNNSIATIRKFYFGEGTIEKTDMMNGINMYSDALFVWPAIEAVKLHVRQGKSPVYLYEFAFNTSASFAQYLGATSCVGVCHGDDLIHLFPMNAEFPNFKRNEDDVYISNKFIEYFTSFAKLGKPTADDSWQRVQNPAMAEYLHIGAPGDIQMRANYTPERMQLWSNLGILTAQKPAQALTSV